MQFHVASLRDSGGWRGIAIGTVEVEVGEPIERTQGSDQGECQSLWRKEWRGAHGVLVDFEPPNKLPIALAGVVALNFERPL